MVEDYWGRTTYDYLLIFVFINPRNITIPGIYIYIYNIYIYNIYIYIYKSNKFYFIIYPIIYPNNIYIYIYAYTYIYCRLDIAGLSQEPTSLPKCCLWCTFSV